MLLQACPSNLGKINPAKCCLSRNGIARYKLPLAPASQACTVATFRVRVAIAGVHRLVIDNCCDGRDHELRDGLPPMSTAEN
jgi:hypothetical protein